MVLRAWKILLHLLEGSIMLENNLVKSPLNYIGGKQKILPQMLPLFPKNINLFVDLFAGGGNVGLNVNAKKIILNDNLTYLIDLYKTLQKEPYSEIISYIKSTIEKYNLSITNEEGYKEFRQAYNQNKKSLDLIILTSYSFNHQIRFNNSHQFNNPFGKNRSYFNPSIERKLNLFVNALKNKNILLSNKSFENLDLSYLNKNDFVYCDPPYLITTGTYNDGKRGFKGWGTKEEKDLLKLLDYLTKKEVKFALSNVLEHNNKENKLLKEWVNNNDKYMVNFINKDYSNSNYQKKNKSPTIEVLITNYIPEEPELAQSSLFNERENTDTLIGGE